MLLSADLAPGVEARFVDGLTKLQQWTETLGTLGELDEALPIVNLKLGEAVDLGGLFQSDLVNPALGYLNQGGTQTSDGLANALRNVLGPANVTVTATDERISFSVVLEDSKTIADQPIRWTGSDASLGLTGTGGASLDVQIDADLRFTFGVLLGDALSPDEAFFVDPGELRVDARIGTGTPVDFTAALGFLDIQVTGGVLDVQTQFRLSIGNPDADPEGLVSIAEILGTTQSALVDVTATVAGGRIDLPFSVSGVQGLEALTGSLARIGIGTQGIDDFATFFTTGPKVTLVVGSGNAAQQSLARDLIDAVNAIGRAQSGEMLEVLGRITSWLDALRTSTLFNANMPLADQTTFSEVLQFAQGFADGVIAPLTDANGRATFTGVQSLASQLATALGVPADAINARYDRVTEQLTFFLRLNRTFASMDDALRFDLNLAPLGSIVTSSQLAIDADGSVQFTLGLDLSPYVSRIEGALAVAPNVAFVGDAVFMIRANDKDEREVRVSGTPVAGLSFIGRVNQALQAVGLQNSTLQPGDVVTQLVGGKLRFSVEGGFTGSKLQVRVPDSATNPAATVLGFASNKVSLDTLANHAFVRDVRVTGHVSAEASDVDATAQIGFFGVGITDGTVAFDATIDVLVRKSNSATQPIKFSELFDAVSSPSTWTTVTRTGTFEANLTIAVTGGLLALPGTPRIQAAMTNLFQANTLQVTTPDLAPLLAYREFALDDVLVALGQLGTYFGQIDNFSFLNQKLPLLNRSVSDLVSVAGKFGDARSALQSAGAQTIQQLERRLEQAFGIAANALTMQLTGTDIAFSLDLSVALPPAQQQIALDLDLGTLAGFTNTDGNNLAGVAHLIDVGGDARLDVQAAAVLNLDFGFDLSNPAAPRAYIRDDSDLALTARVSGSDLDFSAAIGPIGIFVRDGSVRLDNGAGIPAAFTVGFNPVAGDKLYSNQWGTGAITTTLVGSASATLPVYFPTAANPVGGAGNNNIQLTIGNLANLAGTTTLTAPNLAAEIGSIDLFNDLGSLLGGIDMILATIQDAIDGEVFGVSLPFVGNSLAGSVQFIQDLRTDIIQRLHDAFSAGQKSQSAVKAALFAALGSGGANLLLDSDDAGSGVTADDIRVTTVDSNSDGKVDDVRFDLKLGKALTVATSVGFDLGLPGLGLSISDASSVDLRLGFTFDLGIGVSRTHGVYLDTSKTKEVSATLEATLGDFALGGTLGFMRAKASDETAGDGDNQDPSRLFGEFAIDLRDPAGGDNRLTYNELASGSYSFGSIVDGDFVGGANINLDLVLGVPGDFSITDPN
ncbi:MAG: hypothetical protein MUF30_01235, partial [Burkholderiales bacterium]|nr:hypothetical protein [Burkholderiales bacterium]